MLHKKRKKSNIPKDSQSLRYSPPLLFYPGRSPQSPSPFILVEIHKLLIGMWYMPSTAVPAAVQASFAFLCACFVESRGTAPKKISLG